MLLILLLLWGATLSEAEWTRLVGGVGRDDGFGVVVDSDGSVYVCGSSTSPELFGQVNEWPDDENILLSKLSSDGVIEWVRLSGNSSNEDAWSIALGQDGDLYVTGFTQSAVLDGQPSAGEIDLFLSKWTRTGDRLWTRLLGGAAEDYGQSVTVDQTGFVYVAGHSSGEVDGQPFAGEEDLLLAKFDAAGTHLWTRLYGNESNEEAYGIASDVSGNLIVVGFSSSAELEGYLNSGGTDLLVCKWTSDGTRLWTRIIGGPQYERAQAVVSDGEGSIFVTGYSEGSLLGQPFAGNLDLVLVRWTPDGDLVWLRLYGASGVESGLGITLNPDSFLYVTGYTTSPSLEGNLHGAGAGVFITKWNVTGTRVWTRVMGAGFFEAGQGIASSADGSVYLVGVTTSPDFDQQVISGLGDLFVTKYTCVAGFGFNNSRGSSCIECPPGQYVEGVQVVTCTE